MQLSWLLVFVNILACGRRKMVNGLNILAHWRLDGSETGLTLHSGPPKFVDGRLPGSKSIQFDSSSSYARIPGVDLRARSFTIAVWLKLYNINDQGQAIVSDWFNPHYNWFIGLNSGKLTIRRRDEQHEIHGIESSVAIQEQTWFHFAVSFEIGSSTFRLFKDCKEIYNETLSKTNISWYPSSKIIELGRVSTHSRDRQFFGEVMELYFIDGAINSEQLDNLRGCILGTSYKMMYSDTIDNHAIVGPLLKSINTNNDNDCKDACFMNVPDVCYMFNYYPQTKKCELFYKDRVSEYKVEKRNGCYFKTRQCDVNPCLDGKRCYSLGEQSHTSCI